MRGVSFAIRSVLTAFTCVAPAVHASLLDEGVACVSAQRMRVEGEEPVGPGDVRLCAATVRWTLSVLGRDVTGTIDLELAPAPWTGRGEPWLAWPSGVAAEDVEWRRNDVALGSQASRESGGEDLPRQWLGGGDVLSVHARVRLQAHADGAGVHSVAIPKMSPEGAATEVRLEVLHDGGAARVETTGWDAVEEHSVRDALTIRARSDGATQAAPIAWRRTLGPKPAQDPAGATWPGFLSGAAWFEDLPGGARVSVVIERGIAWGAEERRPENVVFVPAPNRFEVGERSIASGLRDALEALDARDTFDVIARTPWAGKLVNVRAGGLDLAAEWARAPAGSWDRAIALRRADRELAKMPGSRTVVVEVGRAASDSAVEQLRRELEAMQSAPRPILLVRPPAELAALRRLALDLEGDVLVSEGADSGWKELVVDAMHPLAWELSLDWGDATVTACDGCADLADVHPGRPVVVRARVAGKPPDHLILRGTGRAGRFEIPFQVRPR